MERMVWSPARREETGTSWAVAGRAAMLALVLVASVGGYAALAQTTPTTFTPTGDDWKGDKLDSKWHVTIMGNAQAQEASASVKEGALTLVAGGSDVHTNNDNGLFVWQAANGDFQATLEIRSMTPTADDYPGSPSNAAGSNKVGLMVRPNIGIHSAIVKGYAMTKGTHCDSRADIGMNTLPSSTGRAPWGIGDGSGPAITIRITRKGNVFTFERSNDAGVTFGSMHTGTANDAALDTMTVVMPDDVQVGIILGGHNVNQVTTAVVGPFTFTQTEARPSVNGLLAATATDASGAPVAGSSLIVKKGPDVVATTVTSVGPSNTGSFYLAPGLYTIETADTDRNAASLPTPFEIKTAEAQELKVAVGAAK